MEHALALELDQIEADALGLEWDIEMVVESGNARAAERAEVSDFDRCDSCSRTYECSSKLLDQNKMKLSRRK